MKTKVLIWTMLFILASSVEAEVGYINGQTFQHKKVEYLTEDGLPLYQGDIVLNLVDIVNTTLARGLIIVGNANYRWPNGVVNYIIQPSLPPSSAKNFHKAMSEWELKTGIRFKDVSNTYIQGMDVLSIVGQEGGTTCASYVGRQGGLQYLWLDSRCGLTSAIHEIVVAFVHLGGH